MSLSISNVLRCRVAAAPEISPGKDAQKSESFSLNFINTLASSLISNKGRLCHHRVQRQVFFELVIVQICFKSSGEALFFCLD